MNDGAGQLPSATAEAERHARRTRLLKIGGTIASAALFGLSLGVLYLVVHELDAAEVSAAFARAQGRQIGLAILFTALSYEYVHELRRELHARFSAADGGNRALLDL